MNILVLHSELGVLRGGGENFTRNLFTAFCGRGHRVSAAFVADRNGRYSLPLPPSIKAIPIRGAWSRSFGQAALSYIGRYIPHETGLRRRWNRVQEAVSWRTIRWHKERFQKQIEREFVSRWNDFDAVYVHGNPFLASRVAEYRPTVLRLPGPVSAEVAPVLRKAHAVCANGDVLNCISQFLREGAVELPVGIDGECFKPGPTSVRSAVGWADHNWVIGYVGRLTELKGVDLLAAAFAKLSRKRPEARLIIIGQGTAERSIRSLLAREIERGLVHTEQDVEHQSLPEWYRAMDLFVMPSRYENFSNSILEALACAVPFLGADVGGNRLLASCGAGWLFEQGSVSALAALLQKAFTERSELRAHGCAASPQIRNRYNWAKSAEVLESIFTSRLGVRSSFCMPRPEDAFQVTAFRQ